MTMRQLFTLGMLLGFVAGCTPSTLPDPAADSAAVAQTGSDSSGDTADTDSINDRTLDGGEFFEDEVPMTMIIYFDFDQSALRAEYADVLARHAAALSRSSRTTLRLEGHADERGSREYNIGLGERRSQAVRSQLLIQGGSSAQISTVSFGEERPAAFGSDEDAYQQNRRVEIKYTN